MATEATNGNGRWRQPHTRLTKDGTALNLHNYAQKLAALLHGRSGYWSTQKENLHTLSNYNSADLILLDDADSLPSLLATTQTRDNNAEQAEHKPALLLVRQPRWPLRKMLLIIRGEATDKFTLEWGILLARRTGCAATLLVVVPPTCHRPETAVSGTLKADTIPGRHVRRALNQFAANQIDGVLKICDSAPQRQLQREITTTSYDLIILGREPQGQLLSWRLDSLLAPLTEWTERPLLLTGTSCPPNNPSLATKGGQS